MRCRKFITPLLVVLSLIMSGCQSVDTLDPGIVDPVENDDTYYIASFINYDQSFLYQGYFKSSEKVVYRGATPTRPNKDGYTYTFIGWDKELKTISEDTTFTAQYSSRYLETFHVKFVNYDNTVLYETDVLEGEDAFYPFSEAPTRPDDDDGTSYTFAGWNKETTNIRQDTVFVAQYNAKRVKYTITFIDYDGSILDVQYAFRGEGVSYNGPTPTRPDDGATVYTFSGWDTQFDYVTSDLEIHAVYSESTRKLKVTYVNYDGSLLKEIEVNYGEAAIYDEAAPTRPAEGRYEYTFSGWSVSDTSKVYKDLVVTAQYSKSNRTATPGLVFNYDYGNGTYYVTGFNEYDYSGPLVEVFIPLEYNDGMHGTKKVTRIRNNAFNNKYTIKSVFIEDNVTSIDSNVFVNCQNLESIRLSDNLEYIGEYFITDTNKIKKIEIPSLVNHIEPSAFRSCMYNEGFTLTIDKKNAFYSVKDNLLMNKEQDTIYSYVGPIGDDKTLVNELRIPDGVKTIEMRAFNYYDYRVKKIIIPSSVEEIKDSAFQNISYLEEVVFEDAACIVGNYAFADCWRVSKLNLGKKIKEIGERSFCNMQIQTLNIPASLEKINVHAFEDLYSLTSISLEDGSENFAMMDRLLMDKEYKVIYCIPRAYSGALKINKEFTADLSLYGFSNTNFTSIEIEDGNSLYASYSDAIYSSDKKTLYFSLRNAFFGNNFAPELEKIADNAFNQNYQVNSVNLSKTNVTEIGERAFAGCGNLYSVTLPETLTTIGAYAFENANISTITIPDSVTSIGNGAFGSCNSLVSVNLGKGLTEIPDYCFNWCQMLGGIVIPKTITRIGMNAFYYCRNLTTVIFIEDSELTTIGQQAFQECGSLKSISIPDSVTTINYGVFHSCYSLETVELSDNLTKMEGEVFYNCNSLKSISIPGTLKNIRYSTFYNCSSLTTVTINEGVTQIDNNAFSNTRITSIVIPSTVNYIVNEAFYNCFSLNSVVILNTTNINIDDNAFYNGFNLYFYGTSEQYQTAVHYSNVWGYANVYFYSETFKEGYWHFVDTVPTIYTND